MVQPPPCPLCSQPRAVCFQAQVLHRYDIDYWYCQGCGLLQTEVPYWLEESYQSAIALIDTGLVQRNLITAKKLACIIGLLLDSQGTYVDVGGGYGLLVRLMRDMGFDVYWHDRYCENLLATGFDHTAATQPIQGITAFEVLEHVYDPLTFLREIMAQFSTATLVMTTELFEGEPPLPQQWGYYALSSGQHVSLFQCRTLRVLAENLGLRCYSYRNFHLLTHQRLPQWRFRLAISPLSDVIYPVLIRPTLRTKQFTDAAYLARRSD